MAQASVPFFRLSLVSPLVFVALSLFLCSGSSSSTIIVDVDMSTTLHAANPLYMGCHSDSGFVHQVTGWTSQMVFGESFERPPNTTRPGQSSYAWQHVIDAGLEATISTSQRNFSHHPAKLIRISATGKATADNGEHPTNNSTLTAGVANRGLGNEGLYLRAGQEYEGYFFAQSLTAVIYQVRLETRDGSVLAVHNIESPPSKSFVKKEFTLTPSSGTECIGIAPNSDPDVHCTNNPGTAHICVKCGGQFTVAVVASNTDEIKANVAYVVLQPGDTGRFKGLNARKDVAETMMSMGIKVIRLGGSFCSVTPDNGKYYQWQKWTGPPWERPSVGAHWDSYGNNAYSLIGGWGPFEMIDYANALGAEPIITTTMTSTPEEFADLVEYMWGNETTDLGKQRKTDGHPEPYRLRFIELGNEQYNQNYLAQVKAMEERANKIGANDTLFYIFPTNSGMNSNDAKSAASLGLGNRLVTDIHVGAGGALPVADDLFAVHGSAGLHDDAAVNFETNAGSHGLGRALDEATDLNSFFNRGEQRMLARTASFCHGRSGHFDMFDQAISFFLPNMTWLQPPGHVHAMITSSWQPNVLNSSVSLSPPPPPPSWTTYSNMGYTCTSSEYRGYAKMIENSPAGCLAAAKNMTGQGINYAVYPGNNNCYVCIVGGNITSKLFIKKNSSSFVGIHTHVPTSVSSQISDHGKSVVVRIVHHGSNSSAVLVDMGSDFDIKTARAVTLASDDLAAENTPADVDNVAPRSLDVEPQIVTGTPTKVKMTVPAQSYTILTVLF